MPRPHQISAPDEFRDFGVRDRSRAVHLLAIGERLPAAASATDQELAVDESVSQNLVSCEQSIQFGSVGLRTSA